MSDAQLKKPRMRRARENLPEISRVLRKIRIDAQLTQADAASKIGVAMLTLSRIENGDLRITARNLEKILNFYDLTLSAKLIGESEGEASVRAKDSAASGKPGAFHQTTATKGI